MTWLNLAVVTLGAALGVSGVVAMARQRTMASPDGEDEQRYGGASAVVLGAIWVVLGAGVVVFSLAPESSDGLVALLRRVGRLFLES